MDWSCLDVAICDLQGDCSMLALLSIRPYAAELKALLAASHMVSQLQAVHNMHAQVLTISF